MRGLRAALTPAWLAVPLFCALPLAYADDADSRFLDSMRSMGADTSDSAGLIEAAHRMCARRASGETEHAVVGEVSIQSNVSDATAYMFVGAAEMNYCPQYFAAYHPGQQ
jgi:Protein of unknown function (DUF732)